MHPLGRMTSGPRWSTAANSPRQRQQIEPTQDENETHLEIGHEMRVTSEDAGKVCYGRSGQVKHFNVNSNNEATIFTTNGTFIPSMKSLKPVDPCYQGHQI